MKKIENIVIYKFKSGYKDEVLTQVCIFYNDGTVKNVSYDDMLDIVKNYQRQEKMTKEEQNRFIKDHIHYATGNEFEKNFQQYKPEKYRIVKPQTDNNYSQTTTTSTTPIIDLSGDFTKPNFQTSKATRTEQPKPTKKDVSNNSDKKDNNEVLEKNNKKHGFIVGSLLKFYNKKKKSTKKKTGKISKFFKKAKLKIAAITTAVAVFGGSLLGLSACSNKNDKANEKVTLKKVETPATSDTTQDLTNQDIVDMAKGKSYSDLLNMTNNTTQKNVMSQIKTFLTYFNGSFANKFYDEEKNIKPALKWNESIALTLAYNDFSKEEIAAIFNGYEVNANKLDGYFKSANLELMGAYVVASKDAPVQLDHLFKENSEGVAWYNKLNNLYMNALTSTGSEQIEAVNKFYKFIYKNFPIDSKTREEGIAHSDSRDIASYKLTAIPMVAAAEIVFQNLDIDKTMSQKVINYFNDTGLCNIANSSFERAQTITLSADTDKDNPLYKSFKNAQIRELKANNQYNVKDRYRDLSELDIFQKRVNGHFTYDSNGNFKKFDENAKSQTKTYTTTKTTTSTKTSTKTTKEKTSSRKEAIKKAGKKKVKDAEKKVDKQIAKENKQAKKQGEKEAEATRKSMQEAADKDTKAKEEQVKENEKDLANKIDNANNKIDENNKDQDKTNDTPVNEKDFGDHNVDFDNDHSDSNGNLDDSVKDITTDSTGADEELPDPNKTGANFDSKSYTKEEYANMVVEYIANNSTSTVQESSYQYTK